MSSTRGDIDLDGQWTTTVQGDRFLLGEDGDGVDKIIVFVSDWTEHLQQRQGCFTKLSHCKCSSLE